MSDAVFYGSGKTIYNAPEAAMQGCFKYPRPIALAEANNCESLIEAWFSGPRRTTLGLLCPSSGTSVLRAALSL